MFKPILLIDNFDSFTHMLADYFYQSEVLCEIVRNNDEVLLQKNPADYLALVISPGPETPQEAGLLMQVLPQWMEKIPVLGICLGHQAIGMYYGAPLTRAKLPRHGKVDWLQHTNNVLFAGIGNKFQATRYHSLILPKLPEELEVICSCGDEIMGLAHKTLPIWGLQFHPESCETPDGLRMVKNFIEEAKRVARN